MKCKLTTMKLQSSSHVEHSLWLTLRRRQTFIFDVKRQRSAQSEGWKIKGKWTSFLCQQHISRSNEKPGNYSRELSDEFLILFSFLLYYERIIQNNFIELKAHSANKSHRSDSAIYRSLYRGERTRHGMGRKKKKALKLQQDKMNEMTRKKAYAIVRVRLLQSYETFLLPLFVLHGSLVEMKEVEWSRKRKREK